MYWSYQSSKSCTVHVNENVESYSKTATPDVAQNRTSSSRSKPATPTGGKTAAMSLHSQPNSGLTHRRRRDTRMEHAVVSMPSSTSDLTTENVDSSDSSVSEEPALLLLHDGVVHGVGYGLENSSAEVEGDDLDVDGGGLEHAYVSSFEESLSTLPPEISDGPLVDNTFEEEDSNSFVDVTSEGAFEGTEIISEGFQYTPAYSKNVEILVSTTEHQKSGRNGKIENDVIHVADEDRLQQDAPVYSYGSDDNIEIVELRDDSHPLHQLKKSSQPVDSLNSETVVGVSKKELYESSVENEVGGVNLKSEMNFIPGNVPQGLHADDSSSYPLQDSSTAKTLWDSLPLSSTVSTNITINTAGNVTNQDGVVEPANHQHAKRVLVNVTISTEESGGQSEASHNQVYVLSVAVPAMGDDRETESVNLSPPQQNIASVHLGIKGGSQNFTEAIPTSLPSFTSPATPTHLTWGGHCSCSCPCLDKETNTHQEQSLKIPTISGNMTGAEFNQKDQERNSRSELTDSSLQNSDLAALGSTSEAPSLDYDDSTDFSIEDSTLSGELSSDIDDVWVEENASSTTLPAISQMETTSVQECVQPTQPPPIILLLEGEIVRNLMEKKGSICSGKDGKESTTDSNFIIYLCFLVCNISSHGVVITKSGLLPFGMIVFLFFLFFPLARTV